MKLGKIENSSVPSETSDTFKGTLAFGSTLVLGGVLADKLISGITITELVAFTTALTVSGYIGASKIGGND